MVVSFAVHANSVRMRRITHHQEPSTFTCLVVVSCQTIMFGPSMEKEELCWIIIKKKRTGFLTLYAITVPFFDDIAMGEPEEDAEGHDVEDDLGQMLCEPKEVYETEKESRDLKHMSEDYKTLLYPGCKQGQKKLGITLELLQWKASNGLSETYKKLTP